MKFHWILIVGLLTGSWSYANTMSCAAIFNEPLVSSRTTNIFEKLARNSPSHLTPLFRLPHPDPHEEGPNGLYVLNPAKMKWIPSNKTAIGAKRIPSRSVEQAIRFTGDFSLTADKILNASTLLRIDQSPILNDRIDQFAGVSRVKLRVSSSDPTQIHQLVLVLDSVITSEKPIVLSFRAPKEPTDIYINFPVAPTGDFFHLEAKFAWKRTKQEKFDLTVFGPIVFERGLESLESKAAAIVSEFFDATNNWGNLNKKQRKTLLSQIISNMSDPKVLEETLQIARKGPQAILDKLTALDTSLRLYSFEEKIEPINFFQGALAFMNKQGRSPYIPVETGEFGREHGTYSHALQLIAMMHGMTQSQIYSFIYGPYKTIFTNRLEGWQTWDILFDAPGDASPHSPLWWRKELERRGIPFYDDTSYFIPQEAFVPNNR